MFWRITCNSAVSHNDCIILDRSSAVSSKWQALGSSFRISYSLCDWLNKVCPSAVLNLVFSYKKMWNIRSKWIRWMVGWFNILRRSWIVFAWFLKTQSSLIYWKSIYFKIDSWDDFVSVLDHFYSIINSWLT